MRIFWVLSAVTALVCVSSAQTSDDYLKLRSQQHIVQPTPGQKLDQILGPSVVEIQGVVQGSFKSGDRFCFMVKRDDGQTLQVDCDMNPPEWLNNGEVPVRMLLHVNRTAPYDPLEAHLISVAPETDISKVDEAYWKAEAAKSQSKIAKAKAVRSAPLASRGGGELYGWIGHYHRGHRPVASTGNPIRDAYRNFVLERNPNLSAAEAETIADSVIRFSVAYGVDARLVMAVIKTESDFRPNETSRTGAKGLGQLMDGTASWMGVRNPYDLEQNLYGMIKLLRTHMDQYHLSRYAMKSEGYYQCLQVVLAAYNAGIGAVHKYGGVPPYRETQAYVVRVISDYRQLCSND